MMHYTIPGGATRNYSNTKESNMETIVKIVGAIVLGVVGIVAVGLLMSLPVMWLWNGALVPAVSGLHEIGWLQAWGVMILCGMLFKGNSTSTSSN